MNSDSIPRATTVYNIKDNAFFYHAGFLEQGRQVLMGVQLPELVLVEFEANGDYIKTSLRELSQDQIDALQNLREQGEEETEAALNDWQSEIGFTSATISVKPFFLPDRWIGIRDLPDHYQEFLSHPENYDSQRHKELQEDIQNWNERGDFVLYWDEEYYLNQDGKLESS